MEESPGLSKIVLDIRNGTDEQQIGREARIQGTPVIKLNGGAVGPDRPISAELRHAPGTFSGRVKAAEATKESSRRRKEEETGRRRKPQEAEEAAAEEEDSSRHRGEDRQKEEQLPPVKRRG